MYASAFAILGILAITVSMVKACDFMGITECNQFEQVREFRFRVFIPRDEWQETCRKMKIAFDCIYKPIYMDGCDPQDTYFYDMQRASYEAVCYDGEYMKHVDCLGHPRRAAEIKTDCLDPLITGEMECDVVKSARACITTKIMTMCGEEDSKYMDVLAYRFLKPYADATPCELTKPEMPLTITTQTSDNEDTTQTIVTGNSMGTTKTTTPKSDSSRVVPSLLASTMFLVLGTFLK